ncbi:hypothetical protein SLEP1_g56558 [Rubroshorea leprosula]|uniref:Uncharacterized protein n=1 Tax=Rubroshorea leprosula TaxID=152421 RepID=A0AAV5ML10_9ROSI|nr:hypothetical protein SLEP1_g56558 [Rubroshorea leprosula]
MEPRYGFSRTKALGFSSAYNPAPVGSFEPNRGFAGTLALGLNPSTPGFQACSMDHRR